VRVLPDVAAVKKLFDYAVPDALAARVTVGTQVRVPLHGRRVAGWVVADPVDPPAGVTLHPLAAVRGWGPPPAVLDLARWAAWRWAGPVSSFLGTASAPVAVRGLPVAPVPAPESAPEPAAITTPRAPEPAAVTAARRAPEPAAVSAGVLPGALAGGTAVVRLAPAADPLGLVLAATEHVGGAAPDAGTLVLAPSQRIAARLAARLRGAGGRVALLPGDWALARAGGCVVVGTRAAAFAPLPSLSCAVVLDAHDEVYHEERAPTWCAWEVVAERARRDGAPCVLVSPCPTLDLLAAGRLVTTSRSAERGGWPPFEIVDRSAADPRTGLFSERVVHLVRWATERPGRRVVCVVNRTGRVRLLACATCRELARCTRCQAAVELVDPARDASAPPGTLPFLRCRRCSEERPVVCTRCGAGRMKALRLGVSRVREELEALAGAHVAEVWGPAPRPRAGPRAAASTTTPPASTPTASTPTASTTAASAAAVLVGTEAVLHRVDAADGVAFLDFDQELLAPRLRAGEEALALLARAARLVAGAGSPAGDRAGGRVLVQTRLARHEVLQSAVSADPGRLARGEWELRHALDLPPVSALALVSGPAADAYGLSLRAAAPPGVVVRGPVDGTWSVRAPDHTALCDLLASVDRPAGRLRVEVDPVRA
jgi:primosomal protein N' (replication factor Y)